MDYTGEFLKFLLRRTFRYTDAEWSHEAEAQEALLKTQEDVAYHFPEVSVEETARRIESNQSELAVYLYRFGNLVRSASEDKRILDRIHWLMRELCSCEIYFSNTIGRGFYVTHGVGTVMGSRNTIGQGFKVFQNVTIGHLNFKGSGMTIGDDVILYSGAMVLGEVALGNRVVVGANTVVTRSIPDNTVAYGNPLTLKLRTGHTKIV